MATKADLEEKIAIIDQAPPCPKHGREALKICMEPGCNDVHCGGCHSGSCQCWNDE